MTARIWAWTGLLTVAFGFDMGSDYFLRTRLLLQQHHTMAQLHSAGIHPESWDQVTSGVMFTAFIGLGIDLARAFCKTVDEVTS